MNQRAWSLSKWTSGRTGVRRTGGAAVAVVLALAAGGAPDDGATSSDTELPDPTTPSTEAVVPDTTVPAGDAAVAETTTTTTPPADEVVASTAPAAPATVDHALGSVEVNPSPLRVVALDRALLDPALALGLPVVGYTTYSDPDGALPDYFGSAIDEFAGDAVWVGDLLSPNLEAIAALQPDLILTAAARHESIYDQLSAIAPTVASESAGGGWKDTMRLVAAVTDRTEAAETLLTDYEARAREVGSAINAAADDPTVSVVRFVDAIRLYLPVSFSGTVLEDAGLARPDSQQDRSDFIRVVSQEELGLADADAIFYTVYDNEAVVEQGAGIQSGALWATLGAVQRDATFAVPDDTWMSGVGWFGAMEILDDLAAAFGVG